MKQTSSNQTTATAATKPVVAESSSLDAQTNGSDNGPASDPFVKAIKKICKKIDVPFTDELAKEIKKEALETAIASISPKRIALYHLDSMKKELDESQKKLEKVLGGDGNN